MAIITAIKKDPFDEKFKARAGKAQLLNQFGFPRNFTHVRRPLRGIVIKDDTYATMEVFEANGSPIPLFNSGAREPQQQLEAIYTEDGFVQVIGDATIKNQRLRPSTSSNEGVREAKVVTASREAKARAKKQIKEMPSKLDSANLAFRQGAGRSLRYSNFLLQSVSEMRQEKYQIMETFGIPFIFFMGERPRIYNYSGILLNSRDFQWRTEFWANYDEYIRGTKLVQRNARLVLSYDDVMVEGYILQAQAQDNSMQPHLINFSFQMFITNYQPLANLGDTRFPTPFAVSVDTTLWDQSRTTAGVGANYTSNVDKMRRSNIQKAAASGSKGLLGFISQGIATASAVMGAVSGVIEGFVKGFEQAVHGRTNAYPVGAFPLVDEINKDPYLNKIINSPFTSDEDAGFDAALFLDADKKQLIASGATDPFGTPQFFVQDESLILNLTQKFNKRSTRKIKILDPGGVFVTPSNKANIGGLFRDNLDEYIDNSVVTTNFTERSTFDLQGLASRKLSEDEVIEHMVKQLRALGAPLGFDTITAQRFSENFLVGGVLRLGLSAASFATATSTPPEPDPTWEATGADVLALQKIAKQKTLLIQAQQQPKADLVSGKADSIVSLSTKSFQQTDIDEDLEILEQIKNDPVRTSKVITADGVETRPIVLRPNVTTPSALESPDADREALERILEQARKFNAKSSNQ